MPDVVVTETTTSNTTPATVVSNNMPFLFGRRMITVSDTEVNVGNVVDILRDTLLTHENNAREIGYLSDYYRGKQSVLHREKEVRPEIKNIVVENNAYDIVSFKVGYVYGDPIQYVRRGDVTLASKEGEGENDPITKDIGKLNEYMFAEDKAAVDREIGETQAICGTAYRGILPNKGADVANGESPFQIASLDPAVTYVVYSTSFKKKPLMSVQVIERRKKETTYAVYTDKQYFEIERERIVAVKSNPLGGIPVIEYPANTARLGAFEVVITMIDALNELASNRMDGIEQFVQSLMKFINCDIDETDFKSLKDLGAIKVKQVEAGIPADVEIMTSELNQTQAQVLVDYMYRKMLKICGMPDMSQSSGGDTGQAVILRDGWSAAESRARDTEVLFKKSEKQFLKIALRILEDKANIKLEQSNIDIKFTRNRTDNLLVKTQGLQNMLEAGIEPATAIEHVGLFSDPNQVYLDSKEYLEKWKDSGRPIANQQTDGTNERKIEDNASVKRDKVS